MSKTIAFGLDIGKSSIKAVSFKKAGDKFELEFASVAPPFIKGIDSESLADHQKLAELIKKMVADTGSRNTHVNISLPENQIYTKIIEMPFISERELQTALKWELEQYIPLPLEQVRTAFQVLSVTEVGGTKRMNVFIVAAPISLVKKYEDVLQMANLVPQTIETEILSAIRSLSPLFAQPQPSMLVSIGSSTTSVAILKAGLLESVCYYQA
jgi:type IV pilus assembly protein PilM